MHMDLNSIRKTEPNSTLGIIRIFLGIMFLATGLMKYTVPMLWEAWSGQLLAGNIPLYEFSRYVIPAIEIIIGLLLIIGMYSRPASVFVIGMMKVATYVHIVADDPALFPLQPHQPVIPLALFAMGVYVLIKGGGSWSRDLRISSDH